MTLVEETLEQIITTEDPQRLIRDKACDSDGITQNLDSNHQIEMILPHRSNRKNRTQDGRPICRYKRRWKVERLFARLHNFRRLVVRYEYYADNLQG